MWFSKPSTDAESSKSYKQSRVRVVLVRRAEPVSKNTRPGFALSINTPHRIKEGNKSVANPAPAFNLKLLGRGDVRKERSIHGPRRGARR